jgi:hypothetical protein
MSVLVTAMSAAGAAYACVCRNPQAIEVLTGGVLSVGAPTAWAFSSSPLHCAMQVWPKDEGRFASRGDDTEKAPPPLGELEVTVGPGASGGSKKSDGGGGSAAGGEEEAAVAAALKGKEL